MKAIFIILAILASGTSFCHQSDSTKKTKIYHVIYPLTGSIIAVGAVSDYIAIPRIKGKQAISDEELLFANTQTQKDLINSIDRWALSLNASNRDFYEKVSDYGQAAIFLLPALLMIDKNIRKVWYDILLMYVEGHTITFSFYNYSFLGPTFQNRFRPLVYYPELSDDLRQKGGSRNSFYSGHTASCAYSTFFMAKVWCDYHPDLGGVRYLAYLIAAVPPAALGWARIGALDHFPSDVATGYFLGAVIGIVLPELHKYRRLKPLSVGMFSAPEATGLTLGWKL